MSSFRALPALLALVVALEIASPASAHAQAIGRRRSAELSVFVGGGQWLPRPDPVHGFGHHGGRALVGLQLERAMGASAWAWAASIVGAAAPFSCEGPCARAGGLLDAAVTRRFTAPGQWGFVYAGGGLGVVAFDETHLAAGGRVGLGLGTRYGVRAEARRQYLVSAAHPHAYSVALGLHARW